MKQVWATGCQLIEIFLNSYFKQITQEQNKEIRVLHACCILSNLFKDV